MKSILVILFPKQMRSEFERVVLTGPYWNCFGIYLESMDMSKGFSPSCVQVIIHNKKGVLELSDSYLFLVRMSITGTTQNKNLAMSLITDGTEVVQAQGYAYEEDHEQMQGLSLSGILILLNSQLEGMHDIPVLALHYLIGCCKVTKTTNPGLAITNP